MDTTWPFNFDCVGAPQNLPSYYDKLIIPSIFYDAVIKNLNTLKTTNTLTLTNLIQNNYPDIIVFNDTLIFNNKSNNSHAGVTKQREKNNIIIEKFCDWLITATNE